MSAAGVQLNEATRAQQQLTKTSQDLVPRVRDLETAHSKCAGEGLNAGQVAELTTENSELKKSVKKLQDDLNKAPKDHPLSTLPTRLVNDFARLSCDSYFHKIQDWVSRNFIPAISMHDTQWVTNELKAKKLLRGLEGEDKLLSFFPFVPMSAKIILVAIIAQEFCHQFIFNPVWAQKSTWGVLPEEGLVDMMDSYEQSKKDAESSSQQSTDLLIAIAKRLMTFEDTSWSSNMCAQMVKSIHGKYRPLLAPSSGEEQRDELAMIIFSFFRFMLEMFSFGFYIGVKTEFAPEEALLFRNKDEHMERCRIQTHTHARIRDELLEGRPVPLLVQPMIEVLEINENDVIGSRVWSKLSVWVSDARRQQK